MFRSFVAAATLLALLACPFRCAAGACGDAEGEATHCPCCPTPPADCGDDAPQPSDDCGCQGICGGAVLPDGTDLDGALYAVSLEPAVDDRTAAPAAVPAPDRLAPERRPRRTAGAALRIALASLLN
ncbi:hypothetical protein [Alienimonas sp. DA493]|uniref:hypothetical protein n=1 Tax=Alienimonas sp. DA493 TaxID=3373605 RepID=UPI003754957C